MDKAIDAYNKLVNLETTARLEAIHSLLGYEYTLVSLTYDKDLKQNDIIDALKKYGLSSPKFDKFIEDHHVSISIYDIP